MFGFDKPETGSKERFYGRIETFKRKGIPVARHHMWWLIHNCFAHPLIGIAPIKIFFEFHDYTSIKINGEV
jgi:hypothetical protein